MEQQITGWTLFTVRGVAVKLHISLLFLLFYVILVALLQFSYVVQASGINPSDLKGSPLAWALLFSLSLLVSIFVHEFGHVLLAQAKGYKVQRVTLMMLGGVSQMERLPEKPMDELKIALIGPVVSLAIAVILYGLYRFSTSANIQLFSFWLAQTNLALGIFNLLPAFPTDGGRVLRAFLVTRHGSLKGTQMAVQVSRAFAWFFGIIGFLQFNFLLVLIALFIYGAAKSELFVLLGQTVLKGMKVGDLLVPMEALPEEFTVADAATAMVSTNSLVLPVITSEKIPAVVDSSLLKRVPKDLWKSTPLKNIRTKFPKVIHSEDPLDEVLTLTLSTHGGAIPVMDRDVPVGLIYMSDLVKTIELRQLTQEQSFSKPWPVRMRPASTR